MNLLGIDFEEWFHPTFIQKKFPNIEKKFNIIKGLDRILELLSYNKTTATFFLVGEIVEKFPKIINKINDEGHEIAFHTMNHDLLDSINFKEKFEKELKIFEKLTSGLSKGFRAPTFSLNHKSSWVIDTLEKYDYRYDSSVVPVKGKFYGIPNARIEPYLISSGDLEGKKNQGKLLEFPIMVTSILGNKIPSGGGFYLRTLPKFMIENTIRKYEKNKIPCTFYIHSWELTPEYMPKLDLPFFEKFVTYHKLNDAKKKDGKSINKIPIYKF